MRKNFLPTPVLAAALGCLALSGCAVQGAHAATDPVQAGSSDSAVAEPISHDPEMRFLALDGRIIQGCAPAAPGMPGAPGDKGDAGGPLPAIGGSAPRPEDLPGAEPDAGTPLYGPGRTPPGTPNADGDIPVPLPSDAPEPPAPAAASAGPKPVGEVPLTALDRCVAGEHARRIRQAFTAAPAGYEALRDALTALDYPVTRIHRMPDSAGAPRVRIDLRFMGNNLALEVTGATTGVTVDPFGVSEREDVQVTDVQRTSHTATS